MDRAAVEEWVADYARLWRTPGVEQLAELFAYQVSPLPALLDHVHPRYGVPGRAVLLIGALVFGYLARGERRLQLRQLPADRRDRIGL